MNSVAVVDLRGRPTIVRRFLTLYDACAWVQRLSEARSRLEELALLLRLEVPPPKPPGMDDDATPAAGASYSPPSEDASSPCRDCWERREPHIRSAQLPRAVSVCRGLDAHGA